jgi:hypothetical protein
MENAKKKAKKTLINNAIKEKYGRDEGGDCSHSSETAWEMTASVGREYGCTIRSAEGSAIFARSV